MSASINDTKKAKCYLNTSGAKRSPKVLATSQSLNYALMLLNKSSESDLKKRKISRKNKAKKTITTVYLKKSDSLN